MKYNPSQTYTREELINLSNKPLLINKAVAKSVDNKTMTRRVIPLKYLANADIWKEDNIIYVEDADGIHHNILDTSWTPYKVDDILWLREPAKVIDFVESNVTMKIQYIDKQTKILDIPNRFLDENGYIKAKWIKQLQGVPNGCIKEMARKFYRVTYVRVERLQSISDEDIIKENPRLLADMELKRYYPHNSAYDGYDDSERLKGSFINLWNLTAKRGINDWKINPYVFVYEYEEIKDK